MLAFFWTLIPAIVGVFQFFKLDGMTYEEFYRKYGATR